jgi:predicted nucleic-acid-binding protein
MKAFIDSNIWLRFFIPDNEQAYSESKQLIEAIDNGQVQPYTSNIVLLEVNYTLRSVYKLNNLAVTDDLDAILKLRNMTLIEKTYSKKALQLYKKINIKFGDCLIVYQVPKNTTLVTYDQDFKKINSIKSQTPGEFLNNWIPDQLL